MKCMQTHVQVLDYMYKSRWAVPIFEEWQIVRENKQTNREENPFMLNPKALYRVFKKNRKSLKLTAKNG